MATRKQPTKAPRRARSEPIDQDLLLAAVARAGVTRDVMVRSYWADQANARAMKGLVFPGEVVIQLQNTPGVEALPRVVAKALRLATDAELIERRRPFGMVEVRLTAKGRKRLSLLHNRDKYPKLGISPIWVEWDHVRKEAKMKLPELKREASRIANRVEGLGGKRLLPEGRNLQNVLLEMLEAGRALQAPAPPKY